MVTANHALLTNLTDITFLDYPSPSGLSVIFFIPGCTHNCEGCQSPGLRQPIELGDANDICEFLRAELEANEAQHLVLSGGDPLNQHNYELTKQICEQLGSYFNICIYSGNEFQSLYNELKCEFLKLGIYNRQLKQPSEKTDEHIQFASSNQQLYKKIDNKFNSSLSVILYLDLRAFVRVFVIPLMVFVVLAS